MKNTIDIPLVFDSNGTIDFESTKEKGIEMIKEHAMKDAIGITNSGKKAEARFRALTGATKNTNHKRGSGDAKWLFGTDSVEIKVADGGTGNQVRAWAYSTLVIWSNNNWYVLPANDVISLLQDRTGQHQPNPFLCATISMSDIDEKYLCSETNLKQKVEDAIKIASSFSLLKELMSSINKEAETMSANHKEKVKNLLGKSKI